MNLMRLLVGFLCLGAIIPSLLAQARVKDIDVVSFLGETGTPLPVEIPDGIEIRGVAEVAVKELPPVVLPPWVKPGVAWIETEKLRIKSVSGQWVELIDSASNNSTDKVKTVIWLYLPTGAVYGGPESVAFYKGLTGKQTQPITVN